LNILERLSAASKPGDTWDVLVLAALDGPQTLALYLDSSTEPRRPDPAADPKAREPMGAYLKSISVEGFRGIGASQTLELPPGPGLTLVVGRNGSGKSSFAEALELLVTGDTYRWANRAKVWREGWRNLHHKPAAIEAEIHVEGEKGATLVATSWKDDADLAAAETYVQIRGKVRMPLADLGWQQALLTYRPFLSYNELGSMLDEGPSKLFDALSAILGLEDLTEAQETLADARKAREKAHKDALHERDEVLGLLRPIEDKRAQTLVAAMETKSWGLDAAEAALTEALSGSSPDSDMQILRQLASLQSPTSDAVASVVHDLREAHKRVAASAGTLAARSKDLAEILEHALRFHTAHGDAECPVCGKRAALDAKWHDRQAKEVERLHELAREATEAQQAADAARKKALALPSPHPEALARVSKVGLDEAAATQALEAWLAGLASTSDLDELAHHIEQTAGPLDAATGILRTAATAELQQREDRWKPAVPALAAWLDQARKAQKGNEAVKPLKAAEAWLKQAASDIRNERFAPRKRPSRSGTSSVSRATSPSTTSSSPAPPPNAKSTCTSRWTAPKPPPWAS
jgi:DNA repair exonuclease SbcCD ATPase subunit